MFFFSIKVIAIHRMAGEYCINDRVVYWKFLFMSLGKFQLVKVKDNPIIIPTNNLMKKWFHKSKQSLALRKVFPQVDHLADR